MPGHESGGTTVVRGVGGTARIGRIIPAARTKRLSRAAARACAARLMPLVSGTEIPKLPLGCLEPFQPSGGDAQGLVLVRTLLKTGIGRPDDWTNSGHDPIRFMIRTIEQAAKRFDNRAIDAVAHTMVTLGTNPASSSWREPEQDSSRVFVAVEATHISVAYLRPTLDLLGKVHERLPATFYRLLMSGVCERILCYDEAEAARYFDYRMEEYAELEAEGATGLEKPQSVDDAKGPWLAPRLRPFSRRQIPQVIAGLRRGSRARRIMNATFDLVSVSRRKKPYRPDWRVLEDCISNEWFTLPFTILAFHEQDIVCQAFESDERSWMEGGDEPCPAFFAVMRPDDPESVMQAFGHLNDFMSVLEALGRLLALLPRCDLLEVEKK